MTLIFLRKERDLIIQVHQSGAVGLFCVLKMSVRKYLRQPISLDLPTKLFRYYLDIHIYFRTVLLLRVLERLIYVEH